MAQLDDSLERREGMRVGCRLGCALLVAGKRHDAVVQDLSATGLRVRTAGELRRGADVVVLLTPSEGELLVLEACVLEKRAVARSLAAVCADAVVLQLREPPPAWLRFVEAARGKAS
jgi:hypothetical protein